MSSDVAIKVEGLSKCYQIYEKPRDRLLQMFAGKSKQYFREFWALNDVSFEIKKGDTIGILGRNGSGKSTLLQIICGTLSPTSGSVQTNGRIAALLELGAGFNPEFTGRENIYLSAILLGLSREEVESRYQDIVSFADIGEFIEQPVKTYSSGMFVRLAFAVNIMSHPEIMIVDEALAVGDMRFQAKCITAMKRIQENGATILFVSHDIGTVKNLCVRGIYLDRGRLRMTGAAPQVAEEYVRAMREEMNSDHNSLTKGSATIATVQNKEEVQNYPVGNSIFKESEEFNSRVALTRYGTREARITYVELLDESGESVIEADFNQPVLIRIYFVSHSNKNIAPSYYIQDDKKNLILGAGPRQVGAPLIEATNQNKFVVTYKTRLPLQEGIYSIQFQLTEPILAAETATFLDVIDDAIVFKVGRRSEGRIWTKVFIENAVQVKVL